MPFQLRRLKDFSFRCVCVRRVNCVLDLSYSHIELDPQRLPAGHWNLEILTIHSLVITGRQKDAGMSEDKYFRGGHAKHRSSDNIPFLSRVLPKLSAGLEQQTALLPVIRLEDVNQNITDEFLAFLCEFRNHF